MSSQGVLVVLEGGEGSGKDTNMERLRELYASRSDVLFTREPGGTPLGERIRTLLLEDTGQAPMAVETELLLFLASRMQLLEEVVRPALARGTHVIANRFGLSTVAYQIFRKERFEYRPFLERIEQELMSDITPYYVLLDIDPSLALQRVDGRGEKKTRFDRESIESHLRVRAGYLDAVRHYEHTIIDAAQSPEKVFDAVRACVTERIPV